MKNLIRFTICLFLGILFSNIVHAESKDFGKENKINFYTKQELVDIYNKEYKDKLPVQHIFGTINKIDIEDDGSVIAYGTLNEVFEAMPKIARMQLEQAALLKLHKKYCKKIFEKKEPLYRIQKITAIIKNSEGKVYKNMSYNQDFCKDI
ncbi:MAG: hypothetical protein ACI4V7_01775 [Succinivibrionaceae bacterium]